VAHDGAGAEVGGRGLPYLVPRDPTGRRRALHAGQDVADGEAERGVERQRSAVVGRLEQAYPGSLPVGAPSDGFGRLARQARSARAGAVPVPVLADTYGPALAAVLAERPAFVKVNADEASEATGIGVGDGPSAEAAATVLLDRGAAGVVVTLGRSGAVVVTADGTNRLVPAGAQGVYPVGSGDAFLAGLAVGIARGDDVPTAARLGMAAGAANASIPGAGELDPLVVARFERGIGER